MVPLASLVALLGSTVVKSLLTGQPPWADVWGSFSERLLAAMSVEQAETSAVFVRIEAKLDRMAVAPYENAMRAAAALLEQAQRGWRRPEDRDRLLHEARMQYVQAVAAAPDPAAAGDAQGYMAMTWLLLGSLEDADVALTDAAKSHTAVVLAEFHESDGPEWDYPLKHPNPLERALLFFSTEMHNKRQGQLRAVWKKNTQAFRERRLTAADHLRAVQHVRRQLGASVADAPMPSITRYVDFTPDARPDEVMWDPAPPRP